MPDIFISLVFKKKVKLQEYKIDLSAYEKIIFVSPVWFGTVPFPLQAFLKKEKENVKNYLFLSLCLGGQTTGLEKSLTKIIGKIPIDVVKLSLKNFVNSKKPLSSEKLTEENFKSLKPEIDKAMSKI